MSHPRQRRLAQPVPLGLTAPATPARQPHVLGIPGAVSAVRAIRICQTRANHVSRMLWQGLHSNTILQPLIVSGAPLLSSGQVRGSTDR